MSRERNGIGTGLILITLGVIFLIDRQSYAWNFGNLWPLLLIVAGSSKMLFRDDSVQMGVVAGRRNCRRENRFSGLWLVMVGVIFLLHQNHIARINQTWPLFIVAAGLGVIFSGIFRTKSADSDNNPTIGQGGQS
jgi:hypothetical protein